MTAPPPAPPSVAAALEDLEGAAGADEAGGAAQRPVVDLLRSDPPGPPDPLARLEYSPMSTSESNRDIVAIWADIDRWLAAHAPGTFRRLKPGADPEALAHLEQELSAKLPNDVLTSYAIHDGYAYLTEYEYLRAATALKSWRSQQELPPGPTPLESAHRGRLQPVWWHRGWFPVAMDGGGNYLCVDLAPTAAGRFGQVLFWDTAEGPRLSEHESFGSWLETYRDALLAGRFPVDEDGRVTPPDELY